MHNVISHKTHGYHWDFHGKTQEKRQRLFEQMEFCPIRYGRILAIVANNEVTLSCGGGEAKSEPHTGENNKWRATQILIR